MRKIIGDLIEEGIEPAIERLSDQAFERLKAEIFECIYKSLSTNRLSDQASKCASDQAFNRLSVQPCVWAMKVKKDLICAENGNFGRGYEREWEKRMRGMMKVEKKDEEVLQ